MTIEQALKHLNSHTCYDTPKHKCVINVENVTLILSVVAGVAIYKSGDYMSLSWLIEDDDNWFIFNRHNEITLFHKDWIKDYKKVAQALLEYKPDKEFQIITGWINTNLLVNI